MQLFSRNNAKAKIALSTNPGTNETVDLFDLLTNIILLNKEERFQAGIYIGYEGQEWIRQASLVLPVADNEEITPYIINSFKKE